jgi:hypothetical protein
VALPQQRFLEVPLEDAAFPARVRLILPPGFRDYDEFKFPLLVNV